MQMLREMLFSVVTCLLAVPKDLQLARRIRGPVHGVSSYWSAVCMQDEPDLPSILTMTEVRHKLLHFLLFDPYHWLNQTVLVMLLVLLLNTCLRKHRYSCPNLFHINKWLISLVSPERGCMSLHQSPNIQPQLWARAANLFSQVYDKGCYLLACKPCVPKRYNGCNVFRPSARWVDCWACWSLPVRQKNPNYQE